MNEKVVEHLNMALILSKMFGDEIRAAVDAGLSVEGTERLQVHVLGIIQTLETMKEDMDERRSWREKFFGFWNGPYY
jgi:hypothetical protein